MATRRFEVWVEGYRANGDRGLAWFAGAAEAESLREACVKLAAQDAKFGGGAEYGGAPNYRFFDPERMTWWGCVIFDNETDARAAFG